MKISNEYIDKWLKERMSKIEFNNMKELPGFAFDLPIIAVSRGDDPLFAFYKEHIGADFYRLPGEWLESVYGHAFDPSRIHIISWFLPQTEDTKRKSRETADCPPYEWTMVRIHGEACNRQLAKDLEQHLIDLGYEAVAPMASDEFFWGDNEKYVKASNWSERHTAYIAGLGTFGLCDAMITEKGKAGRFGSVIVYAPLEVTERKYTKYNEYCLADKGCTACICRCPAGAITKEGHDKRKCLQYLTDVIEKLDKERYGYEGYLVCGLCQTGVPCENRIPGRKK